MIGKRLRDARKRAGLTQSELGLVLGIGKSSISEWEADKRSPAIDVLSDLADALNTTASYLLGSTDDPADYERDDLSDVRAELIDYFNGDAKKIRAFLKVEEDDQRLTSLELYAEHESQLPTDWVQPLARAYIKAPVQTQMNVCKLLDIAHVSPEAPIAPAMVDKIVYTFPAAAGIPLFADDDFEHMEFPADEVPKGADFGVRIQGDSMEPTIADGSIVWVRKASEVQVGRIGVFMIDDSAVCKRFNMDKDGIRLESDNDAYEPIVIDEFVRFGVVGRVLEYR